MDLKKMIYTGPMLALMHLVLILHSPPCFAEEGWVTKKGYSFSTNWFGPGKQKVWLELLKEYIDKPETKYLEIGVYEGRSLLWAMENIITGMNSTAVVIDVFPKHVEKIFQIKFKIVWESI